MERDIHLFMGVMILIHFNSHAHVERDLATLTGAEYEEISTHTLTWSVTTFDDLEV